jgi:hypothetical protein
MCGEASGPKVESPEWNQKAPPTATRCPAARALVRKQLHRRKRNYTASDCSGCTRKPQCATAVLRAINIKAAIA